MGGVFDEEQQVDERPLKWQKRHPAIAARINLPVVRVVHPEAGKEAVVWF